MVLRMASPWQHPDSGIFYFRQRVPDKVQEFVGRKIEKISLRTRDPNEAKAEFVRVAAIVHERWRNLSAGVRSLTEREAAYIAGRIYSDMVERHQDNPSQTPGGFAALLFGQIATKSKKVQAFHSPDEFARSITEKVIARQSAEHESMTRSWLLANGFIIDTRSMEMLKNAVGRAIVQAREQLHRMSDGDYRRDPEADRFPDIPLIGPKQASVVQEQGYVTFDEIIEAEAARRAAGKGSRPFPEKSVTKYKRIARAFADFRDSDNAATVTVEEVEAWGDELAEEGDLENRTIVDRLVNIGTIINWGKQSRKLRKRMTNAETISGNIELPSYVEKSADDISYTMDEARHVLGISRTETDPRTRWLPWLCLYAGVRISEGNALRKSDFFKCEGRWFFRVTTRGGRRTKTARSERKIPLHSALVAEGLLEWVQSHGDERLFAPGATSRIQRWVRGSKVNITREDVAPSHGLRHLFVALCRRDGVQDEPREYMSGHATAKVHAKYGASDVMLPGLARELDKVEPL